jgi:IS4 transposase
VDKKRSQNIFIADSLRKFLILVNRGKADRQVIPKFVFDRGFMGEYLVNEFVHLGITFYLRVKQTIWQTHGQATHSHEKIISYHNLKLRIIRSSRKQQKTVKSRQPWYILTNDFISTRPTITNIYYHRFEIEEWFRDLKHIFHTQVKFIKRPQTLLTIIWFQILGTWLLYTLKPPPLTSLFTTHSHHSFFLV